MQDVLTRGTALNDTVRIICCRTTNLVEHASKNHDCWPTATAALGRVLSVGCMMGSMLKSDQEKIEIQINGQGPIGQIVVDAYNGGYVRGYADNPHVHEEVSPTKMNVGAVVGTDGVIRVIKDLGMKQPFVSEVKLQTGEIGDDFAYYYAESEQTPSVVSVGVLVDTDLSVKSAGGLIIQLLPNATEETISIVEDIATYMKPISQLMLEYDSPRDIVDALFDDYKELAEQNLGLKCECSRSKYAKVLKKLPISDLQTMVDEDHGCEVVCKFCNKKYHFTEKTLQGYIDERSSQ